MLESLRLRILVAMCVRLARLLFAMIRFLADAHSAKAPTAVPIHPTYRITDQLLFCVNSRAW